MSTLVFVIHQDTSTEEVISKIHDYPNSDIVLVTSHFLFPHEKQVWKSCLPNLRQTQTIADFVPENLANDIDAQALTMTREAISRENWSFSQGLFLQAHKFLKNKILHQQIQATYRPERVFISPGLGICNRYWSSQDVVQLKANLGDSGAIPAHKQPASILIAKNGNTNILFFTKTSRLSFKSSTKVIDTGLTTNDAQRLYQSGGKPADLWGVVSMSTELNGPLQCATTIHEYQDWMAAFEPELLVFVDGYHPPNYPESYIYSYRNHVTFVLREAISATWFQKANMKTQVGHPILEPLRFDRPRYLSNPSQVLVALNHAGDWCSLINRCDTDRLVDDIIKTAQSLPHLNFVIRPHPTMNHPMHEGVNSRIRIGEIVRMSGLSNVLVSNHTLDDDLKHADVVISEYSQVLIDALAMGKICVSHNPTNRRSFLDAYEAKGLTHSKSQCELSEVMQAISANTIQVLNQQAVCVQALNAVNFEARTTHSTVQAEETYEVLRPPINTVDQSECNQQSEIIKIQRNIANALNRGRASC